MLGSLSLLAVAHCAALPFGDFLVLLMLDISLFCLAPFGTVRYKQPCVHGRVSGGPVWRLDTGVWHRYSPGPVWAQPSPLETSRERDTPGP